MQEKLHKEKRKVKEAIAQEKETQWQKLSEENLDCGRRNKQVEILKEVDQQRQKQKDDKRTQEKVAEEADEKHKPIDDEEKRKYTINLQVSEKLISQLSSHEKKIDTLKQTKGQNLKSTLKDEGIESMFL